LPVQYRKQQTHIYEGEGEVGNLAGMIKGEMGINDSRGNIRGMEI